MGQCMILLIILLLFIYLISLICSNHILEARGNEHGTSKDIHILKVNPEPPYYTSFYVYHRKIPLAPIFKCIHTWFLFRLSLLDEICNQLLFKQQK